MSIWLLISQRIPRSWQWHEHEGYDYDVLADEDGRREGIGTMAAYACVLNSTHPEYQPDLVRARHLVERRHPKGKRSTSWRAPTEIPLSDPECKLFATYFPSLFQRMDLLLLLPKANAPYWSWMGSTILGERPPIVAKPLRQ
ncbi:N,N-dimethylformamidase beta subunit family domain-containing protein [Bradyrhizobium sp. NBAIM01]|uniref:N,N-dimethylformamidase beta subunit family domain-containing protein n=1 Tax=Bradyrhizobium sp. NBAIM01 TaxID=2793818 RepID=UPI001CD23BC5|nr:N,N-dimethylformamidase beta subunit family domain-containing protein [Bradyrhizobium sp. NBAIM01]MCA1515609.1 hypothetical protein [Bradyrhizobium sp. NBAIM01]